MKEEDALLHAWETKRDRQALDGGEFRLPLRVEGGGSSIVQGVAANPGAIGFASIFFACKGVRVVPLAGADGRFCAPTTENVRRHQYPLSRFLYICLNKPPPQPFGGPAAEFLRFLLSRDGQQVVADGGNIPLDAPTVNEGRRALGFGEDTGRAEHPRNSTEAKTAGDRP
jgi:phosphate transport system substrate-binding protein